MRITPAYAGKRQPSTACTWSDWDHPRVCGEKKRGFRPSSYLLGSPPRMRGKDSVCNESAPLVGITPAYAGKRLHTCGRCGCLRDHPRVCGEKSVEHSGVSWYVRITPAYAGKSIQLGHMTSWHEDHPRVCGEKYAYSRHFWWFSGITPAYAGKRLKRSRSTVPPVAIVPLFPSVCNKPVVSDGSPAGRDAPLFLPAENAVPASPAYNLRSL